MMSMIFKDFYCEYLWPIDAASAVFLQLDQIRFLLICQIGSTACLRSQVLSPSHDQLCLRVADRLAK